MLTQSVLIYISLQNYSLSDSLINSVIQSNSWQWASSFQNTAWLLDELFCWRRTFTAFVKFPLRFIEGVSSLCIVSLFSWTKPLPRTVYGPWKCMLGVQSNDYKAELIPLSGMSSNFDWAILMQTRGFVRHLKMFVNTFVSSGKNHLSHWQLI